MNIFSKFFKHGSISSDPEMQFGRFTDTYKSEEKYKIWDEAIEDFENEKYLNAYIHFLDYLSNELQGNIKYVYSNGKLSFTIYQGSKIIEGEADFHFFKAEAKIIKAGTRHSGLMRKLLEDNFNLKYARYALDDEDTIYLKFDTFVEDGSPHKIYQALKELATEADRKDDILMNDYPGLHTVNLHHTRQVTQEEIEVKYNFFSQSVRAVLHEIDNGQLDAKLYPGGISFLVLDLLYKIDYLVKPEGSIMEKIREMHEMYFNDNMMTVHEKNTVIINTIRNFEKISVAHFSKEIYEVSSTFGMSMPEGHQRLIEIVDAQMTDIDWYTKNKHYIYTKAICGYITGFSLYSFSLPKPSISLLQLYYHITENQYFSELGFNDVYCDAKGNFNKLLIINKINLIIKENKEKYGPITINLKMLEFSDMHTFCRSYLLMLSKMKYPEY
jgi:hypothetical protein